ncbi:hypothetical protein CLV42_1502 [Chitinophaga ginsengisoli]|uniref:Uncharacterized protein n=1 Tax=Chitinophaga ginsengisoli TaxID=363837 RepID=A0A2P8F6H8_9BACT|nr:hypothetical protein CLV42_1502 [Chitinophaga ginsengisoli]
MLPSISVYIFLSLRLQIYITHLLLFNKRQRKIDFQRAHLQKKTHAIDNDKGLFED